jgi:hypothetical protein
MPRGIEALLPMNWKLLPDTESIMKPSYGLLRAPPCCDGTGDLRFVVVRAERN